MLKVSITPRIIPSEMEQGRTFSYIMHVVFMLVFCPKNVKATQQE